MTKVETKTSAHQPVLITRQMTRCIFDPHPHPIAVNFPRQVPSLKQFYKTFLPSQPMETESEGTEAKAELEQLEMSLSSNWRRPASVNIRNERESGSREAGDSSGSPIFTIRKQERSASLPSTAAESLQLPSDLICNKKMRATLLKANIDPTSQEGRSKNSQYL